MSHQTKAEQVVAALRARGCTEVIPSTSRKYRQFTIVHTDNQNEGYYWVGKMGAWRKGRCASKSISLESRVPGLLAKYGQQS